VPAIRIFRKFRDLLDVTFGAPADQDVVVYDLGTDKLILVPPPSGAPSGPAGGDLSGTYPNPLFGAGIDRVDGVNEVRTLTIAGSPTGGSFTITYNGFTTSALAFNSTAAQVAAALVLLPSIGSGGVACAGGPLPGTPITIERTGPWAAQTSPSTFTTTNSLTGGTAPTVTIVTTTPAVPFAPDQNATQIGAAGVYLAVGDAIKMGNGAGTSWVPVLTRDASLGVVLRSGGGLPILFADTSSRLGLGLGNVSPGTFTPNTGGIVLHNAFPGGNTDVVIARGLGQVANAADLLRFVSELAVSLGARFNENGYFIVGKTAPPADAELDPSEGNWSVATGLPVWKGKNAGGVVQNLTPVDTVTFNDHSARHEQGGADAIKLDDLATPDDNTDLNASTLRHGLLQKLPGGTTDFLRADGTFAAPPGGGGGVASDAIWDAKGDLAVGTGADAAARVAIGANGTRPVANSALSAGLEWSLPPGYEVAFAQTTADVTVTATVEASADTLVTLGSVTYAAVPHIFEFFWSSFRVTGVPAAVIICLFDGATEVNRLWQANQMFGTVGIQFPGCALRIRLTPTAAAHTYSVRAFRSGGTNAIFEASALGSATDFMPMQMRAVIA
jgi:hypothetical protein